MLLNCPVKRETESRRHNGPNLGLGLSKNDTY